MSGPGTLDPKAVGPDEATDDPQCLAAAGSSPYIALWAVGGATEVSVPVVWRQACIAPFLEQLCHPLQIPLSSCVIAEPRRRPILRAPLADPHPDMAGGAASPPLAAATPKAQPRSSAKSPTTSTSTTPSKKITFNVPAPPRSGNRREDDMHQSEHLCLVSVYQDLADMPELRASVFNFVQQEKKRIAALKGLDAGANMFNECSTLQTLDEQWKVQFVTSKSDLSSDDVVHMMTNDPSSLNDLFCFAVQLPMRMKLPSQFRVKDVLALLVNDRYDALGKRLENFKKLGGLRPSGELVFNGLHGCYFLEFDATSKLLSKIKHYSGDEVEISDKLNITANYVLQDNFDDFHAHLSLPPLQNVKLAQFFNAKSRQGPYRTISFQAKAKMLGEKVHELYHEWELTQKNSNRAKDVSVAIAEEVTKHRKEEQKKRMTKAREVAIAAMSKKKARRCINLG